jgi:CRISPR/Cas system-associated endonuclease/helicase Cas3
MLVDQTKLQNNIQNKSATNSEEPFSNTLPNNLAIENLLSEQGSPESDESKDGSVSTKLTSVVTSRFW